MKKNQIERLEAQGWKVGDVKDFLGLSAEEMAYIEIKLSLSQSVREIRKRKKLTQEQTANIIGSSQSRVAKIEAGDPSVSIDLQIKSLIALGASKEDLAQAIKSSEMVEAFAAQRLFDDQKQK
jgi:DNA-binding XRE family transcriptional regulator